MNVPSLGLGIGWRPELALAIDRYPRLGFIELLAEDFPSAVDVPESVHRLKSRGVTLIPHGISLSLGGADRPDPARLTALGDLAKRVTAPLVSEHIAFVRAGGMESGHLLPLPRTEETIRILVENIREAKDALPVPLALENVASLLEWPHAEMDEAAFLAEVIERADVGFLLDIENLYANARNHGWDAIEALERLPLQRIAYVHIAGGVERRGVYHDTHGSAIPAPVLELLEELSARVAIPGVMLERDDYFPKQAELHAELDAIGGAVARGRSRREAVCHV